MLRNISGQVQLATPIVVANNAVLPSQRIPVSLADINNMTMADYLKNIKHQIIGAVDHRRYDTNATIAGQDILKGTYEFFNKKVHAADRKTLDGGTTIVDLDDTYTNMLEEKKIEAGWSLIVDSLQVDLVQSHRDFFAFTTNTGEPSTGAPSATDSNSATTQFLGLCRSLFVQFETQDNVDKEIFAQGRIDDFPSARAASGAFGGSTPEGFIQNANANGRPEYLRSPVVLQSQHLFRVVMTCMRQYTCPLNAEISVGLCGLLVPSGG